MTPMKRRWSIVGVSLLTLLCAPYVVSCFRPGTELRCEHQEINIKTGQARFSNYLWYVKISERVEDTWLSLALQGERVDITSIRAWHRANTFSPGVRHSPHYAFHSALFQAHELTELDELCELTAERKREIARTILSAWQESGADDGANAYISDLFEEAFSKME
jgi:hypothetical protein